AHGRAEIGRQRPHPLQVAALTGEVDARHQTLTFSADVLSAGGAHAHASATSSTAWKRPKASQLPIMAVSSTISASVNAARRRAKNASSIERWSSANLAAYSIASSSCSE